MAHYLQQLLGTHSHGFSRAVLMLESRTGHKGTDTRLLGDILYRGHDVLRSLGLDPSDTTPIELYAALNAHANNHQLFEATEWVGLVIDGQVISLNRHDIATNKSKTFELRESEHLRAALSAELKRRYQANTPVSLSHEFELLGLTGAPELIEPAHPEPSNHSTSPMIFVVGDSAKQTTITLDGPGVHAHGYRNGTGQIGLDTNGEVNLLEKTEHEAAGAAGVAIELTQSGHTVELETWLGDDELGKHLKSVLIKKRIGLRATVPVKNAPTSQLVIVKAGMLSSQAMSRQSYNYGWVSPKTVPTWLVLTETHERSHAMQRSLLEYLHSNPSVKFMFMPGQSHHQAGRAKMREYYQRADVVLLAASEASLAVGRRTKNMTELMVALHGLGADRVVLYDTTSVHASEYTNHWKVQASDLSAESIASTVLSALVAGHGLSEALSEISQVTVEE